MASRPGSHPECALALQTLLETDGEAHSEKAAKEAAEERLAAVQAELAGLRRESQQQITRLNAECQAAENRAAVSSLQVLPYTRPIANTAKNAGVYAVFTHLRSGPDGWRCSR